MTTTIPTIDVEKFNAEVALFAELGLANTVATQNAENAKLTKHQQYQRGYDIATSTLVDEPDLSDDDIQQMWADLDALGLVVTDDYRQGYHEAITEHRQGASDR